MFRTGVELNHVMENLSETVASGDYSVPVEKIAALANVLNLYLGGGPLVADNGDGLTLTLGGNATATGEDTLATGELDGLVVDKGPVTIGVGSATFEAAGETSDGSAPYASASSFADAEGADFIFKFDTMSASSEGAGQTAQTSQSTILAIDFEGWDFANGPVEIDLSGHNLSGHEDLSAFDLLTGNVAEFVSDLEAVGENTISDLDYTTTTVEDSFSDVTAVGVVGVA